MTWPSPAGAPGAGAATGPEKGPLKESICPVAESKRMEVAGGNMIVSPALICFPSLMSGTDPVTAMTTYWSWDAAAMSGNKQASAKPKIILRANMEAASSTATMGQTAHGF